MKMMSLTVAVSLFLFGVDGSVTVFCFLSGIAVKKIVIKENCKLVMMTIV